MPLGFIELLIVDVSHWGHLPLFNIFYVQLLELFKCFEKVGHFIDLVDGLVTEHHLSLHIIVLADFGVVAGDWAPRTLVIADESV